METNSVGIVCANEMPGRTYRDCTICTVRSPKSCPLDHGRSVLVVFCACMIFPGQACNLVNPDKGLPGKSFLTGPRRVWTLPVLRSAAKRVSAAVHVEEHCSSRLRLAQLQ